MVVRLKISRGGIFEKFSARGRYTNNTPYPLFPLPDIESPNLKYNYAKIVSSNV